MSTYIKLDDVNKILDKYTFYSGILRDDINSLSSVSFEEMIKEMLDSGKGWNSDNSWNYLQELLNKLPK